MSLDKLAMKRVYMECWKDLTNEEKQAIFDLKINIGVTGTLTMYCEATTLYVKRNRGKQ